MAATGSSRRPRIRHAVDTGSERERKQGEAMRLISVNVGLPRQVSWKGESVTTGIFKARVEGRVEMRVLNLDGPTSEGFLSGAGTPSIAGMIAGNRRAAAESSRRLELFVGSVLLA